MIQSNLKSVKVEAFGEGFKGAKWQHKHRLYNSGRAVIDSSKTYTTIKNIEKRIVAKLHEEEEKSLIYKTYITL